jgi:hypothetical protein
MSSIFISYRREDAEGQAGRLYRDLAAEFGSDSVFMDVAAIQPGRDFRRAIDQSLSSCSVFLSLIGKNWLSAQDPTGQRRLDDSADFVRVETSAALKRDIPVIPVLVQGASTPRSDQLPDDLRDLAYRNAMELTHPRWDSDVQLLIKALRPYLANTPPPAVESDRQSSAEVSQIPSRRSGAKSAALIAIVLIAAVALLLYLRPARKIAAPEDVTATPTKTAGDLENSPASAPSKFVPPMKTAAPDSKEKLATQSAGSPLPAANSAPLTRAQRDAQILQQSLQLSADKKPFEQRTDRFHFTLSLNVPDTMLPDISNVHYDLVYASNPLSIDGGPPPDFSASYDGWGCYTNVVVTVDWNLPSAPPFKKTFNMCSAIDPAMKPRSHLLKN